jgi:hypothetical protein
MYMDYHVWEGAMLATIKQHISTPVVPPLIVHGPQTRPRAALCSRLHRQCAAKLPHYRCLRLEHVDSIVSVACGLAVVVKHPMKFVVHRLRRFPRNGHHDF